MAEPFLSEIRMFSFAFAPKNWAMCNGQLLPINQNQALFSLLGTTYGGDGQVTFALPDLRGRVPIHFSGSHSLGQRAGEQAHTLTVAELPGHLHDVRVDATTPAASNSNTPTTASVLGQSIGQPATGSAFPLSIYGTGPGANALAAGSITSTGGNQAHLNMQPFLVLNHCIALQGIFPSPN